MARWIKFIVLISVLLLIASLLFRGLNYLVSMRDDSQEIVRIMQTLETNLEYE